MTMHFQQGMCHSETQWNVLDVRYGMAHILVVQRDPVILVSQRWNGGGITNSYGDRTDTCHCFGRAHSSLSFGGGTDKSPAILRIGRDMTNNSTLFFPRTDYTPDKSQAVLFV